MISLQVIFFVAVLVAISNAGLPNLPPDSPVVEQQAASGNYGFRYSVNDFNGNEHSHQQSRNGDAVTGQYKVLLPDGRLQTVTYVADAAGYRAKVDYTPAAPGEATTAGLNTPATAALGGVPAALGGVPATPQSAALPQFSPNYILRQPNPPRNAIYPGGFGYPNFPLYQDTDNLNGPGLLYSPFTLNTYFGNGFGNLGLQGSGLYAGFGNGFLNGNGVGNAAFLNGFLF